MSDIQRDIEQVEWVMSDRTDDEPWAAWQRLKPRLTPDRERVARAIFTAIVSEGGMKPHQFETLDGEVKKRLRALADAAIDAMKETP